MERQAMSWGNLFKSGSGRQVVSKVDQAREEGYDAGYVAGAAAGVLHQPELVQRAEERGYIQGLENAVLAIESMPSRAGRNQILAVLEPALEGKRQEQKEDQAQEVRGD